MSKPEALRRARRALAFARHVPPSKLVRRIELELRRRVHDLMPRVGAAGLAAPPRASRPPIPVFTVRAELAPRRADAGWRFEFLHRFVDMAGPRVDWTAPGSGSTNQLWRMNLHYMSYLEGLEEEAWSRLVADWIEANSMEARGAWQDSWNSYALSLRVVVWLQELARRSLPPALVERVEASAAGQLIFLERNLETDIGGNHLIKNIKALLWASAYFIGAEAERWRAMGMTLLEKELLAQILPDGMHYERSPSYHCQVFADLLECRHALGGDPLNGRLDEALSRMAQATADLAHPDGQVALFNDAGLTMAYQPSECLDVYEQMFARRPSARAVFALPKAGYFGFRDDGTYLLADCGRIAPDDLPAHGHGDALSFEWSVAGKRVIVDQGVFEYNAGERRQVSRSATNHNTLCFDGDDQADFFGAFRCGRRPNVELRAWEPRENGFTLEGTHDGFARLKGRPRHVRRFVVEPASVLIHDRIEGAAKRCATIGFLLHPSVEVEKTREGLVLLQEATKIWVTSTVPLEIVPAVWWPDMGRELLTKRIVVTLATSQDDVRTLFRIVSGEARA